MIEYITRQFVFDNYEGITSEIVDIQKAMFDSDPLFKDGDNGKWYIEMHDALNIPLNDIKKHTVLFLSIIVTSVHLRLHYLKS